MRKQMNYNVLFIGDYFSLNTDILSDNNKLDEIALEASQFIDEYYGWSEVYAKSKQIVVRDDEGNELGEAE